MTDKTPKAEDIAPTPPYSWECPYCHRPCTIGVHDEVRAELRSDGISGCYQYYDEAPDIIVVVFIRLIMCPNEECRQLTLTCSLNSEISPSANISISGKPTWDYPDEFRGGKLYFDQSCTVMPPSSARHFPDYVPEKIREDYEEACLIKKLSPKSSATLARSCIQAIMRDFYGLKDNTIAKQIESLKKKVGVPSTSIENFELIRRYGNIGAHPPKNINQITPIQEGEADALIQFIESAIEQTYVRREQEKESQEKLKNAINSGKSSEDNSQPTKQQPDWEDDIPF